MHRCLATIDMLLWIKDDVTPGGVVMRKMKLGILAVIAVLALVSVASAFPSSITTSLVKPPNAPDSYFKVVTATGDSDVPAGTYDGMCVGFTIQGVTSSGTWKATDSRLANPNAVLPDYVNTVNWNKMNWIVNNPAADWRITQAAIWKLDGASGIDYPSARYVMATGPGSYNNADFDTYMGLVNAQGSFVPTVGDLYVVILTRSDADGKPLSQPILIPAEVPSIPSPEFPTIALPVGMLVGMVGAVAYLRTKNE